MSTTVNVFIYTEEEALSPFVPAVSEGLHDRISTRNPHASLFAKKNLKIPTHSMQFFVVVVLHLWGIRQKMCLCNKVLEASGWITSHRHPSSGLATEQVSVAELGSEYLSQMDREETIILWSDFLLLFC